MDSNSYQFNAPYYIKLIPHKKSVDLPSTQPLELPAVHCVTPLRKLSLYTKLARVKRTEAASERQNYSFSPTSRKSPAMKRRSLLIGGAPPKEKYTLTELLKIPKNAGICAAKKRCKFFDCLSKHTLKRLTPLRQVPVLPPTHTKKATSISLTPARRLINPNGGSSSPYNNNTAGTKNVVNTESFSAYSNIHVNETKAAAVSPTRYSPKSKVSERPNNIKNAAAGNRFTECLPSPERPTPSITSAVRRLI